MAVALSELEKGHAFSPRSFHLSPDWVAEYVATVEDGAIAALGGEAVPPMAVAALAVRSLLEAAALPPGAIHLAQELSFLRPVRTGEQLSAKARVTSRGERAGWLLMGIDLSAEGATGASVMTGRATVVMPLRQEEPRTKNQEPKGPDLDARTSNLDRQPSGLPSLVKPLTQEKIDRYAGASGDGNPLHTDPQFAARTQFGGTIAHGMLLLAYISEMMTAAFARRWLAGGRLKVRFRAPARPGDAVTTSGYALRTDGARTVYAVHCLSQRGEVLVDGEAGMGAHES